MRQSAVLMGLILVLVAQSSPVATQPWNLPRPVVFNGCTENQLFLAVRMCAASACSNALPRYANVDTPYTICCSNGYGGYRRKDETACRTKFSFPIQPYERAPRLQ